MHKRELINLIFNYFNNDLESVLGEGPSINDLENLKESQLWAIAIDMDILGENIE